MVRSRKKTPSRSRATSRKIRQSTIGTHVSASPESSASGPSFSSGRKTKKAQRGVVEQVMPQTSSRESRSEFNRRSSKKSVSETMQRKRSMKTLVIALAIVLVAVVVVAIVGSTAYYGSVSSRMALSDTNTKNALVAAEGESASYTLIAGELYEKGEEYLGPGLLILARVDKANGNVTLVNIPSNTRLFFEDRSYRGISESQLVGNDAKLISTVSDFAGVPISHFVKIGAADFVDLVDTLDGVTVNVTEEVDDPSAGPEYIGVGEQTLTGDQALIFARAKNYKRGVETRMTNQGALLLAIAEKVMDAQGLSRITLLDSIADYIETDYSANDVVDLADAFAGLDISAVEIGKVPGYEGIEDTTQKQVYFYVSDSWKTLMNTVNAGASIAALEPVIDVDPASFKITVRNGSGLTGGAQRVSDLLTAQGYLIESMGNADSYVYEETLVIYQDDAHKQAALSVVEALGIGRAVPSNGFYSFDTEILVVFGSDWKPLN